MLVQPEGLLHEGLRGLLEAAGYDIAAHCRTAVELARCLASRAPDIALFDDALERVTDLVGHARGAMADGKIVLLASAVDRRLARATVELGVDAVLLKSASADDVVATLDHVRAGATIYPNGWLRAARGSDTRISAIAALSDRQWQVLELLAQGLPNEEIAERLFVSRNTIKFHVAAIYQRLGVRNRVQAAHALDELLGDR